MTLRKYVEKIQDASNRKILQSLSGACRDAYKCALSAGATEHTLRVPLRMRHHGSLTDEQFVASCENSVYVTDLEALMERFQVCKRPACATKTYSYPAAFLGACFGDIAGSAYEGDLMLAQKNIRYENCITQDSRPTDDTILSCATAVVLGHMSSCREFIENRLPGISDFSRNGTYPFTRNPFTEGYRKAVHTSYPHPGFGGTFYRWATSGEKKPYGSAGNGTAMRVSPITEMYGNQKKIICLSAMSADATHNHYEGVKGAVIAAMMIWMAYRGYDKEQIFQYMLDHYRDAQNTLPSAQRFKKFDMQELQQKFGYPLSAFTVPAAAICFHESASYEDVITNVLSFGGDTDTICAVAGGIAGAYYGVPESAQATVMKLNTDAAFREAYKILGRRREGLLDKYGKNMLKV